MIRFNVTGGQPLKGTVRISGSKNAALPAMAAALLADTPTRLTNMPSIRDVEAMAEIIRSLGAMANKIDDHTWEISGAGLKGGQIDYLLGRRLRASILLLGPLLARLGSIQLPHPGGCVIGKRPVGSHFEAMTGLGASISQNHGDDGQDYYFGSIVNGDRLHGAYLYLDEVSVTATENGLMAAVLAEGKTVIRPAALEPHVVNLGQMLIKMGARISGLGSHTLVVEGVDRLNGVEHAINSDEIETGTYIAAAAVTNGDLTLTNVPADLDPILYKFHKMGLLISRTEGGWRVRRGEELVGTNLQVDTWPRFPTDLQPQFGVVATQANGKSTIHEWMYEQRLKYLETLALMGADIDITNAHQAVIHGPTPLKAADIASPDLRSGIAFVLAALVAEGESRIDHAELILRGYDSLIEKLTAVGATISQSEVEEKEEAAHAPATTSH